MSWGALFNERAVVGGYVSVVGILLQHVDLQFNFLLFILNKHTLQMCEHWPLINSSFPKSIHFHTSAQSKCQTMRRRPAVVTGLIFLTCDYETMQQEQSVGRLMIPLFMD